MTPSGPWPRRLLVLLIAAGVQLPLWWSMEGLTGGHRDGASVCDQSSMRTVRLHPSSLSAALLSRYQAERCPKRPRPVRGMAVRLPKEKPEQVEPPLPDDSKIVETPDQPEPERPSPSTPSW